jgi:hypothetical protein
VVQKIEAYLKTHALSVSIGRNRPRRCIRDAESRQPQNRRRVICIPGTMKAVNPQRRRHVAIT